MRLIMASRNCSRKNRTTNRRIANQKQKNIPGRNADNMHMIVKRTFENEKKQFFINDGI